jgi:hypothetical protein
MILRPCRADKRLLELVRGCELLPIRGFVRVLSFGA